MSDSKGWICLHRKIQECSIWDNDEKFDCRSAWIDLLLLANHEDKKTLFDGKPIVVKRGQRITSVRQLAERWHWSNDRTLKYLRLLESENMIKKESDKRRTLLTIVNYGIYNDMPNSDKNTERTVTRTDTEHCPNTDSSQTTIYNNDNNENNILNNIHTGNGNESNNTHTIPPTPQGGKKKKRISNRELLRMTFEANPNARLSEVVIEALYEWAEYKEQRKEYYKDIGLLNQLKQVQKYEKEYGGEAVADCIRGSMADGYQGMTLDKLKKTRPQRITQTSSTGDWAERMKRERGEE